MCVKIMWSFWRGKCQWQPFQFERWCLVVINFCRLIKQLLLSSHLQVEGAICICFTSALQWGCWPNRPNSYMHTSNADTNHWSGGKSLKWWPVSFFSSPIVVKGRSVQAGHWHMGTSHLSHHKLWTSSQSDLCGIWWVTLSQGDLILCLVTCAHFVNIRKFEADLHCTLLFTSLLPLDVQIRM